MILRLERDVSQEDIEVRIKYADRTPEVERVISLVRSIGATITCADEGGEKLIGIPDVYYIESVDKKTFVYCEKEVYQAKQPLYRLLEQVGRFGFAQVSKSCIINIQMLESIKPLANSRMEATLKNSERIYVNRKYLAGIKQALQEGRDL